MALFTDIHASKFQGASRSARLENLQANRSGWVTDRKNRKLKNLYIIE